MKKLLKITLILANILVFAPFLKANFCLSIPNKDTFADSINLLGAGNNYYNAAYSLLLADKNYENDSALKNFSLLLESYKKGEIDRADAFKRIKPDTALSDIIMKFAVVEGDSGVIFIDVIADGKKNSSFVPFILEYGMPAIGGDLSQNANLVAMCTIALNYGEQVSADDLKKFKVEAKSSSEKVVPIVIPLSKGTKGGIPSHINMKISLSGALYDEVNSLFAEFLESYKTDEAKFLSYWGKMDVADIEKALLQSKTMTSANAELNRLKQLKNGFKLDCVSKIGDDLVVAFVSRNGMRNNDLLPFFLRKYDGEYKFTSKDIFGSCSLYAISFFNSFEFKKTLLNSSILKSSFQSPMK